MQSQLHQKRVESLRDAYGETLIELGKNNKNIVVLDADLSKSTKTELFAKVYPDRFFNLGIQEANMIGVAAGLAISGKLPICSTFAVFATGRCYDQIRQSIAYPKLNVKIVASHGGITVAEDGASHQTTEDIGMMRGLPNMTVIVPADAIEVKKAVREAVENHYGPAYIRLSRPNFPIVYTDDYEFQIGKGVLLKEGEDVTIIACGIMVSKALIAADELEKENISAAVINMHTIKPLDKELIIKYARKTGYIITCEEHNIINGLGSAVAEVLSENIQVPLRRIGVKDKFGESGSISALLKKYELTEDTIINEVKVLHTSRDYSK